MEYLPMLVTQSFQSGIKLIRWVDVVNRKAKSSSFQAHRLHSAEVTASTELTVLWPSGRQAGSQRSVASFGSLLTFCLIAQLAAGSWQLAAEDGDEDGDADRVVPREMERLSPQSRVTAPWIGTERTPLKIGGTMVMMIGSCDG